MALCPSCGGVVGRDCFNTQECAWITAQMERQGDDKSVAALQAAKEAIDFASDYKNGLNCPEPLIETWGNMVMNALSLIEEALNSKGISIQKTPVHSSDPDDLPF